MSDNPFSEPDDSERTVLRGPGGLPPPPPAMAPPVQAPFAQPATAAMPQGMAQRSSAAGSSRMAGEADVLPKVGRSPMVAAAGPLLDLLARIGASSGQGSQVRNAEELRESAMRALQAFEAECRAARVPDDQLRAGHYALCAALDDTALSTHWGQASSWGSRTLSSTFHQDVRSGERFFDLLNGMQQEPGRYQPALEICYMCLSLGFRGRYRLDSRGSAELERIREGLYRLLAQLGGNWERELSPNWRGVDAPHRGPPRSVPPWVAAAVALSLLAFGYVFASHTVNDRGDALQQRMMALPPTGLPAIARAAVPVAPAAAPVADSPLLKFRSFLAPEIRDKLVVVEGDAQRVVVRILGRGMFASGSADLQPRYPALLARIGEALKLEPGRVMVAGHTDNQPIRTVKFPSNFQLSTARAEAARAVLASTTGQPERVAAAGRADTEPLAPNTTPEGREQNRRIDVVLSLNEGR
jgi:type VI secretion system protein ImpK